jgi:hypothetical protein
VPAYSNSADRGLLALAGVIGPASSVSSSADDADADAAHFNGKKRPRSPVGGQEHDGRTAVRVSQATRGGAE